MAFPVAQAKPKPKKAPKQLAAIRQKLREKGKSLREKRLGGAAACSVWQRALVGAEAGHVKHLDWTPDEAGWCGGGPRVAVKKEESFEDHQAWTPDEEESVSGTGICKKEEMSDDVDAMAIWEDSWTM